MSEHVDTHTVQRRTGLYITITLLALALVLVVITGMNDRAELERQLAEARQEEQSWNEANERARAEAATTSHAQLQQFRDAHTKTLADRERQRYLRQIAQARQAWESNNIFQMRQLLDRCPAQHRGWEWDYLTSLPRNDLWTIPTGTSCTNVRFRPDGRLIVYGGFNQGDEVLVVDPATKSVLQKWPLDADLHRDAFSPDGKSFVAVLVDKDKQCRLQVVDLDTGKDHRPLGSARPMVYALAFRPDGKHLAVGGENGTIRILEVANGTEVGQFTASKETIRALAYSPDGQQLASLSDRIRVQDLNEGQERFAFDSPALGGEVLAWSPDGQWIAATGRSPILTLVDAATGKPGAKLIGHRAGVSALAFRPDGQSIVTGSADRTIRRWDCKTGQQLDLLRGHESGIEDVTFSPDGRLIASCAWAAPSREKGEAKVWDATRAHKEPSRAMVSPEGIQLVSGETREPSPAVQTLPWVRESQPELEDSADCLSPPIYDTEGKVAVGWNAHRVHVWNAQTGKVRLRLTHPPRMVANRVAFTPNGDRLAVSASKAKDEDQATGIVTVYELKDGKECCRIRTTYAKPDYLVFSPNGKLLLLPGKDAESQLRDCATGEVVARLNEPRQGPHRFCFRSDGAMLATASESTVRLWAVKSGQCVHVLHGHLKLIQDVTFHRDGQRLITSSADEVKLWDVETGTELITLDGTRDAKPDNTGHKLFEDQTRLAWHQQQAKLARDAKQVHAQLFHLAKISELTADSYPVILERARIYQSQARFAEAFKEYDRAVGMAPRGETQCLIERARMAIELGKSDQAMKDFTEAIQRDQRDAVPRILRARLWRQQSEWQQVIDDLEVALAQEKGDASAWANRGRAHAELEQWKSAYDDLSRALMIKPDQPMLHEERAVLRLSLGDVEGYKTHVVNMMTRFSGKALPDEEARLSLAFAMVRVPNTLSAEKLLREALIATDEHHLPSENRDLAEQRMVLGATFFRAGMIVKGRDYLLEAEKLRDNGPSALDSFFLALCYHSLGERNAAVAAYRRGVSLYEKADENKALAWHQRITREVLKREVEQSLKIKR